ncbi:MULTISPECIES: DNA primase [unclassified Thermosynechococcus]|uniref:DNA primase n=1 Tax=unclassified Thermosynechococcus TaxID=2622553 RepID=UPI002673DD7E|nr:MULTISPECIES: DNA primase [unclassified Thermosynechococcus]WKT83136.1 DNA primase [Thermosynechococcus sp. HY596]WNC62264.1 DNA primase [Thermosynechococcus sp. HY591]WNC64819.1 DNA primase [Thermosynechococcus sp. HY593]
MEIPRLHPDTIEAVRQAVNIVDVVAEHVVLRKRGQEYVGCCPFHEEKTPSFTVSPLKGFYYCFGCGAGGNAIKFLMELQKRSFAEVVLDLAQRHQIPVRTLDSEQKQALQARLSLQEQLYEILAIATSFYEHALRQPIGQAAQDYLQRQRHLKEDTIQQFRLGYAPAGWQVLYTYLVEQKGYPPQLVEQAGLIMPRQTGDGYYDRFRDRLMIPIMDAQGRVVGFGGRTLSNEEPKYLNSPETPIFNKGQLLFGLDKARQAIARKDQAIVVEGYFDVMALHQAGFSQAVASLGTALSQAQIKLLLRYTESKQIILNFDADPAGERAADRAIGKAADLAYRGDLRLRILTLPAGKDAADFFSAGEAQREHYQALLDQAPLWLDWQIQTIVQQYDLKQSDQFQQASQALSQLLGKLPNATLRSHYIHHCAELLGGHDSRFVLRLEESLRQQVRGQRWQGRSQKWQRPADYNLRQAAEEQLLRLYLHCGDYRPLIRQALQARDIEFSLSHHRWLWRQILAIEEAYCAGLPAPDDPYTTEWLLHSPTETGTQLTDLDLVTHLFDRLDEAEEAALITPLLHLDETTAVSLDRPELVIQAAAAALERIAVEKRCRYILRAWQETVALILSESLASEALRQYLDRLLTDNEPAIDDVPGVAPERLQVLAQLRRDYYQHRQYLQQLDQQRCPPLAAIRSYT